MCFQRSGEATICDMQRRAANPCTSPQPPSPLRARRLMLGLRQIDVAELADLSREQIIRLEAGTSAPGQRTAERLAIALRATREPLPASRRRASVRQPSDRRVRRGGDHVVVTAASSNPDGIGPETDSAGVGVQEVGHVPNDPETDSRRNGGWRQSNWIEHGHDGGNDAVSALADAVVERLAPLLAARAVPALVDTAAASDFLGVPESWLAARARNGEAPCRRLGKYVRFESRAARVDRRDERVRSRRGSWTSPPAADVQRSSGAATNGAPVVPFVVPSEAAR